MRVNEVMKVELEKFTVNLHFATVVGSRLQGLESVDSDTDVKFVYSYEVKDYLGMGELPTSLDDKNTSKEDKKTLLTVLENMFQTEVEDFSGFEVKQFFKNALKTDPNMLDMLNADKVPGMVKFCSKEFKAVMDNKILFLDFELARNRFLGMSYNCLKLGKKETNKNKFKDLAKSLQSLYSFWNLVEQQEFNPRLDKSQSLTVLDVKLNLRNKQHQELVDEVQDFRQSFEKECRLLELPTKSQDTKANEMKTLNELLLNLRGV